MPNLPTFNVAQEHVDRLMGVYGSPAEYITWLKKAIREHVLQEEKLRLDRERRDGEVELSADLDGMGL